jgi:chaperonin GroEL
MRVRDGSGNAGFNTLTGEYEELISAGVADPAIICRSALQNAASIGSPILTYEAVVAPPPEGAAAVSRAGHNMDFI